MRIDLATAVKDSEATLLYQGNSEHILILGAASDNRLVKQGDLFVCIKGENVDGHSFAKDAMQKGAVALLAEKNPFHEEFGDNPPIPVLLVDDSVKALGKLAHACRVTFGQNPKKKVIAVTGTAGKTSLKELVAHILSLDSETFEVVPGKVAKNPLNYNTQIGMPITILNASGEEDFWVLELGISHAHDMDELGEIATPDYAIILNAANAHTEWLGEKGVAYHKARLLSYVKEGGLGFVNAAYPDLVEEAKAYACQKIYFGTPANDISEKSTHFAEYHGLNQEQFGLFTLFLQGKELEIASPFIAGVGIENCSAAASLCDVLAISDACIIKGMANVPLPKMRFNRIQKGSWNIIDDCYNANLLSTLRMVEAVEQLAKADPSTSQAEKDFYLVLGEMKELGKLCHAEHINLGKILGKTKAKAIFWLGNFAEDVKKGLVEEGFHGDFHSIEQKEDLVSLLKNCPHSEKLILFKASRSNALENYLNYFMDHCHAL